MTVFLKGFSVFEFRKKHHIRNFPKRLNIIFQFIKVEDEFLKDFHFLQSSKSFQSQGYFS